MSKKWKKPAAAKPTPEGKAVDAKQDPTDVQSVICPKSAFPTADDARKWAESRDYAVDAFSETEDTFIFEQFPTKDCTSTPARRESLEGGALAIICQRKIEDGGGAVVPESSGMKGLPESPAVMLAGSLLTDLEARIARMESRLGKGQPAVMPNEKRGHTKGFEDGGGTDDPMQEERLPISIGLCRAVKELLDANVPLVDSPDMRAMFGRIFTCMQEAALETFPTMDLAWLAPGWPQEPGSETEAADADGAGVDSEGEEEEIAGMIEESGDEDGDDADPDDMESKGDEGMTEADGPDGGYLANEDGEPEEEASDADDEEEDEGDDKPGKKKPFGKSYWGAIAAEVAGLKSSVRMLTGRLD